MARQIVVRLGDEVSSFGITRVSREKLYGRRMRVVVDENGEPCKTALLTRDGSALLPQGTVSMIYLDDDFEVCERSDLQAVDEVGEPLEEVDSTLGVETELQGPVDATRVLDHVISAVYELEPDELSETLKDALEGGDIYETRFNYRKGFDDAPCFLLHGEEGYFALIGRPTEFEFLYLETRVEELDDDEDPFDDDLDFSMM